MLWLLKQDPLLYNTFLLYLGLQVKAKTLSMTIYNFGKWAELFKREPCSLAGVQMISYIT